MDKLKILPFTFLINLISQCSIVYFMCVTKSFYMVNASNHGVSILTYTLTVVPLHKENIYMLRRKIKQNT